MKNQDQILEHNGTKFYNYLDMICEYKNCKNPLVENCHIFKTNKNYCKKHYDKLRHLDDPFYLK